MDDGHGWPSVEYVMDDIIFDWPSVPEATDGEKGPDKMKEIIDKLSILIVLLAIYIPTAGNIYMIVPILIAIISSALLSYVEDIRIKIYVFVLYLMICFFMQSLLFFIPLICYDVLFYRNKMIWVLAILPFLTDSIFLVPHLLVSSSQEPYYFKFLMVALIGISCLLKYRTIALQKINNNFYQLRDNTQEISIQLEKKNQELLEKQDYEINLATLSERNRIARDIHDNVGHLLSRSILQMGAMLAISKDPDIKEDLKSIKLTLSEAMDSIRSSVHDLHEKSIDLHTEIQKLIEGFKFCPFKFEYEISSHIEDNLKHCFITIIKEAMSNIAKHSNATRASILIREHPALYQLVIQDNGTQFKSGSKTGIGINNIHDRITSIGGNVNIKSDNGFRIFISIPKK